jgi:diamine N-acetyltransferase
VPTLEPVRADTLEATLALRVAPGQEHLVRPVVRSLAEAYVHPDVAWPRVVVDDGAVVAFVMAFLDSRWDDDPADVRSGLWRLVVDQAHQTHGYGRFAVEAVCRELELRGASWCYVTYHPGPGTPEPFYRALGFEVTGEVSGGETVARRRLR